MRIGYDVRLLAGSDRPSGIGNYALSLIKAMRHLADLVLFSDRPWQPPRELKDVPLYVLPSIPGWQQTLLPIALSRKDVQVFHGLSYTLPAWTPCKTVLTVHDLGFVHSRETLAPDVLRYLSKMAPPSITHATRVIVPSHAVREELVELMPAQAAKVRVVSHGVDAAFAPLSDQISRAEVRDNVGQDLPYVLAVGTQEPRKNLRRLVEAFVELKQMRSIPHRLLLIGNEGASTHELVKTVGSGAAEFVQQLGYVQKSDLVKYYQGADAFAYPSIFEGFGMPLLEAMAVGCPIVTSDRSTLREVAGDAALYVEPTSVESIRQSLQTVLTDATARATLRHAGLLRSKLYTWQRTAALTLKIYHETIAGQLDRCD